MRERGSSKSFRAELATWFSALPILGALAFGIGVFSWVRMRQMEQIAPEDYHPTSKTKAEMRKEYLETMKYENIKENNRLIEQAKYVRNKIDVGETLKDDGELEIRRIQLQVRDLEDDRKRYDIELHEIKTGTWKAGP